MLPQTSAHRAKRPTCPRAAAASLLHAVDRSQPQPAPSPAPCACGGQVAALPQLPSQKSPATCMAHAAPRRSPAAPPRCPPLLCCPAAAAACLCRRRVAHRLSRRGAPSKRGARRRKGSQPAARDAIGAPPEPVRCPRPHASSLPPRLACSSVHPPQSHHRLSTRGCHATSFPRGGRRGPGALPPGRHHPCAPTRGEASMAGVERKYPRLPFSLFAAGKKKHKRLSLRRRGGHVSKWTH